MTSRSIGGPDPAADGRETAGPPPDGVDGVFRAWLQARSRLTEAIGPLRHRMDTPLDPARLTELRAAESRAWADFRAARLAAPAERVDR